MSRRTWAVAVLLASALAGACSEGPLRKVVVETDARAGIDLATASWEPASAVRRADLIGPTRLELELEGEAAVRLTAHGACPLDVPRDRGAGYVHLRPWIDLGPDRPQLGYGASFRVRAEPGCPDAEGKPVRWRVRDGAQIPLQVADGGAAVTGAIRGAAETFGTEPAWGLVPVSPRTSGAAVIEASFDGPGWTSTRTVRVGGAARATGLPTLSVGQRALLSGRGWSIEHAPPNTAAVIELEAPGLYALQPDVPGRWVLRDEEGRELSLSSGRHDTMPLDCGRAECHAAAAQHAAHSPMTHVLRRGMEGELGADYDPSCAIACHATGEPGVGDGFDAVAEALGVVLPSRPEPGAWAALPAPVRRLAVVGCTACHGPSALPEPSARWRILHDDVCATCHDAPPRYGHVVAWRGTRMARADRSEGTGAAGCRDCHTTAGFLAAQGIRPLVGEPTSERMGIGCAACHAPHGPSLPGALLRRLATPSSLSDKSLEPDTPARVCLACHAPRAEADAPASAAGALWLGQGGRNADKSPLIGGSPHTEVEHGCIGCHASATAGVERGASHGFSVDHARCQRCHGAAPPEERPAAGGKKVAERARAAWDEMRARGWVQDALGKRPPHASRPQQPPSEHAWLVWNVLLVLEDPAAGVHNAPYARALLDEVDKALK